ncbi:hypothetical protein [Azospirillum palustre]
MEKGRPDGTAPSVRLTVGCRFGRQCAQSVIVCQKKNATARTMMAMSMGTAPVDDGG